MSGSQQQAREPAPGRPVPPAAAAGEPAGTSERELAGLRRELASLRGEVSRLAERVQHLDGELGFAMMTAGRLRGRLDREVEARTALEVRLAEEGLAVLPEAGQSAPLSRSRRAAWRSGTRSFLTEVDT